MESLRLADVCAAPFERALTLVELAELRVAQGDPYRNRHTRRRADNLRAGGSAATLERVDALRHRSARREEGAELSGGLSPREVEVFRLVAEGMTDAEIAEKLFLSRRTVSAHLRSVYNKIGIGSRAAAAVWAKEQGVI